LAEQWYLEQGAAEPPVATINSRSVDVSEAVAHAAALLVSAKSPLIYGLSRSSTDGQRAAVRLADAIGATIDTTASRCHAPSIMAIQQVGESTCTLGEARNRCDLVVFWGCDPVRSHPRHAERYSLDPCGLFTPRGRRDRYVIVLDCHRTESAELADWFVQPEKDSDFDLIWSLRYLLRGGELTGDRHGLGQSDLQLLADRLKSCRSGIFYFGLGIAQSRLGHATVEALLRLTKDLNAHTRFYARRMRIPGDVTGADTVLCWQTGFPFAVNLSRGYPRYNPGEYSANELLSRKEVDACLLVGSEGVEKLGDTAKLHLCDLPVVALDYPNETFRLDATVQFTTAIYGIHTPGTAYRMDEVPIPLRAVLPRDYPTDHELLEQITAEVRLSSNGN
jgi:formylmethanofuran dehydrogenase subunit B